MDNIAVVGNEFVDNLMGLEPELEDLGESQEDLEVPGDIPLTEEKITTDLERLQHRFSGTIYSLRRPISTSLRIRLEAQAICTESGQCLYFLNTFLYIE